MELLEHSSIYKRTKRFCKRVSLSLLTVLFALSALIKTATNIRVYLFVKYM